MENVYNAATIRASCASMLVQACLRVFERVSRLRVTL
jgi:hypothetical protein